MPKPKALKTQHSKKVSQFFIKYIMSEPQYKCKNKQRKKINKTLLNYNDVDNNHKAHLGPEDFIHTCTTMGLGMLSVTDLTWMSEEGKTSINQHGAAVYNGSHLGECRRSIFSQ